MMNKLGALEAQVMTCLWASEEPLSVRDVSKRLPMTKTLAYTTVMTVLDNLHRKHLVTRQRQGKAYIYEPAATQTEYESALIESAISDVGDPTAALLAFVTKLSESEQDQLRKALRKHAASSTSRTRNVTKRRSANASYTSPLIHIYYCAS